MSRLRISAISYLNTAPLMWNFEHTPEREKLLEKFAVSYTIPSLCAQALAEGTSDIGIVPVAAYTTIPGLRILPDVAIASKHAVRSILLVSRRPIDQIRSVALDSSSRSSAALLRVLFAKLYQREAQFNSAEPDLETMLKTNDAALLIGDPALQVDRSKYLTLDLCEEWRRFTGKPFVFAFWAARSGAAGDEELSRAAESLRRSRDAGLRNVDRIARSWSTRLSLSPESIESYLSTNIHYYLDDENISGMQTFFRYAEELKVLPAAPELRIVAELESRNSALTFGV
jgi:chorismate dehydratase